VSALTAVTTQSRSALPLTLPARSIVRTRNECAPADRGPTVAGLAQPLNAAVSREHWSVPGSLAANVNVSAMAVRDAP